MIKRLLSFLMISMVLMSAKCSKFDCARSGIEKCEFQMNDILSSQNDEYMAVSGKRVCAGHTTLQEVMVYKKGESLNNKCGNAYITTDTINLLHIMWKQDMLQIINTGFESKNTLLRETKLYGGLIRLQYGDDVNPK